jgi:DNA-binding transcriptional ArsR family regulator
MESSRPVSELDGLARDLSALAHPVRLQIIRHLAERDACCNKDVVARVGLAQSTVSQHLKMLVDSGLVLYAQDAQRSRYRLNPERIQALLTTFHEFTLNACCCGPDCAGKDAKA